MVGTDGPDAVSLVDVADLVIDTPIVASQYCDQSLFFRHPEATSAP